ncbi:D-alanyl-D-alanine carboxypeptidase [Mesorhizobium sp. ZC-5]|nr:D-alanyl-D-alanine carboxypeptidase family protein [Mesorhizobium sp. ZC-5]MCV3240475.1 D-alanyl-D-alanine carboxypeptidase [Mesorhizobium sp. ZC-5]
MAMTLGAVGGTSAASSKYAAIVVDANTGKTLFSANADAPRYPASLTKMMTLYMLFEALDGGRLSLSSRVPFSAQAAAEPPTKLGVKAGNSITVETAIYSMVTKSANDSATAVAELLGGSQQKFARMMTAKARRLGMSGTTFQNAHGLPDSAQKTTARDMAVLGIALREHFPRYYKYFSARSFQYGRQRINGHNRLLGRIKGVDGIKTGYTRASGFNLASSVSDGNRSIVAVVMGGQSGRSRDAQMAELIKKYLPKASTRDSGPLIAMRGESPIAAIASAILPKRKAPTPDPRPDVIVALSEEEVLEAERQQMAEQETVVEETTAPIVQAYAEPAPRPKSAPRPKADVDPIRTSSTAPEGWAVQVASSPSAAEAEGFLAKTTKRAPKAVASASPFTVPFVKDGTTYYRARFGGFGSKTAAWDACAALKKKKISCYAVQQ